MTDGNKRIPVSEAAFEKAQAAKTDDETWSDYVLRCTDTPPETQELVPVEDALERLHGGGGSVDTDALAEAVASRTSDAVVSELEGRR